MITVHRANERRLVPVLVGPTAAGKTDVSLFLARLLDAEIISADSRQVYRYMDIGTAKPTLAERALAPHHFVDILDPDRDFTAGDFGTMGRQTIDAIFARHHVPLVVGGSGLYVQSLIDGFFEGPGADKEYREILERRLADGQLPALIDELRRVDPESVQRIDPTKPRRIVRALEVYHMTGKPLSLLHREAKIEITFTPVLFGLEWERQELYARINQRCDAMLESGLVDEVEHLEAMGYDQRYNALNTVGYAEVFAWEHGEFDREAMVRLFKQNTRRYAKRQMTWFRRDTRIHWIPMSGRGDPAEVANAIAREVKQGGNPEHQIPNPK